jgi:hypothetical protein
LVKDQELPADIRMAIAREFSATGTSRSGGIKPAQSFADKRLKPKSAGPRRAPSSTANSATLDILFGIVRDTTVDPDQRRKAASEAAQHFLPKTPGIRRWWVNAPVDEYGFAITPEIAAEYRDTQFALWRLAKSETNSPATTRKAAEMQERLKAIRHRLQRPCPSLYGDPQWVEDGKRVQRLFLKRKTKATLSEKEDAEQAHRLARFCTYVEGPKSAEL